MRPRPQSKLIALVVLISILFFRSLVTQAQWTSVTSSSLTLGSGAHPGIVSDGSGGAIIGWFPPGAKAQRINGAGVPQWTAGGVTLGDGFGQQVPMSVIGDGTGGSIIAWIGTGQKIFTQKINAAGIAQWTAGGVALTSLSTSLDPTIVSDGSGGAIICWFDSRSGASGIYAQRINSAGIPQWTVNGINICTSAVTASQNSYGPRMQSDGSGGAYIAWRDSRAGTNQIYAQRISAAGTLQWGTAGLLVCALSSTAPDMTGDGSGGSIISWQDNRSGTGDIYAQRINTTSGTIWDANGISICNATATQAQPKIFRDGSNAIIAWTDGRAGTTHIYAQKIDVSTGAALWTANGNAMCTAAGGKSELQVTTDQAGGAIATWMDLRSGTDYHIYAQRINSPGTVPWPSAGIAVATFNSGYPVITTNGAQGAIIAFSKAPGTVYAQHVNGNGTIGPPPAPIISSYTPTEGFTGEIVTITGSNFTGATKVKIGTGDALSFTIINDNTIQAKIGPSAFGPVTVITPSHTIATSTLFYYRGYKSAANGNWSSTSTWFDGLIPTADASVLLNHNVNVDINVDNMGPITTYAQITFTGPGRIAHNLFMAGNIDQTISGVGFTPYIGSLDINKSGGKVFAPQGLDLMNLVLSKGIIQVTDDTKKVSISEGITHLDGYVIGKLSRYIPLDVPNVKFPVGTLAGYTPVEYHFTSTQSPGTMVVRSYDGKGVDYPNGFSGTQYLGRHWIVTSDLQVGNNSTVDFTFLNGEITAGTNQTDLQLYQCDNSNNYVISPDVPFTITGNTINTQIARTSRVEFGLGVPLAGQYISAFMPAEGYFGTSFTITGINLGAVTGVKIGGVDAVSFGAISSHTIKGRVGHGATGLFQVTTPAGTISSLNNFTFLGYITQADGDWNDPDTWQGYEIPPPGARVTIKHNVTNQGAFVNTAEVLVDTASAFRLDVPFTNNGILRMNGTLEIGTNGSYTGNPPIYAKDTSALVYNKNGTMNIGNEWTAGTSTPGEGVPENVTIATGTVNMPVGNRNVSKQLKLKNGNLQLNTSNGNLAVAGDIKVENGTLTSNGRTIIMNGAGDQRITGSTGTPQLGNVTVNKPTGNLILPNGLILNGNLTMSNGNIIVPDASRNIHVSGTITRTNGYVNGTLSRSIGTGSSSLSFPVGTNAGYTPANLEFTGVTVGGVILVRSTDGRSTNYPSGFSSTKYLNRFWTVNTAISFGRANATFEFLSADLVGGVSTNNLRAFKYNGTYSFPSVSDFTISGTTYAYNNITSFSEFGAGENTSSLPVTLVSFNASVFDGNKARLFWNTATELNFAKFVIERSNNGSNFTDIGSANAKGDNSYYEFNDNPVDAVTYYRLRMVDIDGKSTYSKVITVTTGFARNMLSMFPNPANGTVTISHPRGMGNSSLTVATIDAKILRQQVVMIGAEQSTIDLGGIPSGSYLLSYRNGDEIMTIKFVKR